MEHLARVSFRIVGKREDNPTNTIEITASETCHTVRHVRHPGPGRKWFGLWLVELTPLLGVTS